MIGTGNIGTLSLIARMSQIERENFIGQPQITFFKSVYRRHTNFSKFLSVDDQYENSNSFGIPRKFILDRSIGDLLSKVYLQHKIVFEEDSTRSNLKIFANLGSNLIKQEMGSLKLTIGTNNVFQNSSLYIETKQELMNEICLASKDDYTVSPSLEKVGDKITCNNGSHHNYTTFSGGVSGLNTSTPTTSLFETEYFYMIPDFSFQYDYGLSLPLCCMRNEEIVLDVDYNALSNVINITGDQSKIKLHSSCIREYIHLDIEEKKRFLTNSHKYIIETVKEITCDHTSTSSPITSISNLTKYILIVGTNITQISDTTDINESNSTPKELNDGLKINLLIDNNNLNTESYDRNIFTRLNLYKYFPGCGRALLPSSILDKNYGHSDTIAVFPVALEPLNMTQPSGCISTRGSGVRNILLDLQGNTTDLTIYSIDYNILNISDGHCQKLIY